MEPMLFELLLSALEQPWEKFGLAAPFRVKVDGKPIDATHGHANPLLVDFDGDGSKDLLVGQFQDGQLRIYLNGSKSGTPQLKTYSWFTAGGSTAQVPYG